MQELYKNLSKFSRIVLWGYRTQKHSHGYIHQAYFEMLKRLELQVYWVDNTEEANEVVISDSLIMIPDVHLAGSAHKNLMHKFRDDVYYICHSGDYIKPEWLNDLDPLKMVRLYEYRSLHYDRLSARINFEHIRPFVLSSFQDRTIIQPWGTDLWPDDFLEPVFPSGKDFYFVGTIWGDPEGLVNGNRFKLAELEEALAEHGINFHQISNVSSEENIALVRKSRLSASIGAVGHSRYSYLQCRTFKNISYGQPTITDVSAFDKILEDTYIDFSSWKNSLLAVLSMSPKQYADLAKAQQNKIKNYTYLDMWKNMIALF